MSRLVRNSWFAMALLIAVAGAQTQPRPSIEPGPNRGAGEGDGPFDRLVIRGATMIDGAGAPPVGPVDSGNQKRRLPESSHSGGEPPGQRNAGD
jgi:hypothetical protein